jgi:biopolymer transport protein ExbD
MAANVHKNDDDVIAQINIIPFVDIVLVLLIIFMVTSTAIVKAAIKVDLPKAANTGDAVAVTVNLVVTKDKALFIDGAPTTRQAASEALKRKLKRNPDLQAVISADRALPYGEVVSVIDFVKGTGVKTFALNIEKQLAAE